MASKVRAASSVIRDSNYVVIQGWMLTRLGLKGNELMIYAVIYGFTQNGETEFIGSSRRLHRRRGLKCIDDDGLPMATGRRLRGRRGLKYRCRRL